MDYSEKFCNKVINKALEINGDMITIEEINEQKAKVPEEKKDKAGKVRKNKDVPKPYYLLYPWKFQEYEDQWLAWLKEEIRTLYPKMDEEKLDLETRLVDSLTGLSTINLLQKATKFNLEKLKTEKL